MSSILTIGSKIKSEEDSPAEEEEVPMADIVADIAESVEEILPEVQEADSDGEVEVEQVETVIK